MPMSLDLKVIGAGLGRTGTTSLKEALSLLLGGDCFHFLEFKTQPQLMSKWLEFVTETPAEDAPASEWFFHWQNLLAGYSACVDEPCSWYWKQLWTCFPDALVILSIRDSESWWESVESVTLQVQKEKRRSKLLTKERQEYLEFLYTMYPGLHQRVLREDSIKSFEEHNQKVLDYAGQNEQFRNRLLVWNASDGWEPICDALDLAVPDVPFPHRNRRGEFHGY